MKKSEIQVIVFVIMLTRSSEKIFNSILYTSILLTYFKRDGGSIVPPLCERHGASRKIFEKIGQYMPFSLVLPWEDFSRRVGEQKDV